MDELKSVILTHLLYAVACWQGMSCRWTSAKSLISSTFVFKFKLFKFSCFLMTSKRLVLNLWTWTLARELADLQENSSQIINVLWCSFSRSNFGIFEVFAMYNLPVGTSFQIKVQLSDCQEVSHTRSSHKFIHTPTTHQMYSHLSTFDVARMRHVDHAYEK